MKKMMPKSKDVPSYLKRFSGRTLSDLKKLRALIKKEAPEAVESMSYGMPAYNFHGPLVYFNAYPTHIGFYPTGSGIAKFKSEFKKYSFAKGTLRFPIGEKVPFGLIKKIVKFRVKENLQKSKKI